MIKDRPYISSIKRPNLLYGALVRSEIPCGMITSIDIPPLPDSIMVLTGKDIPGSNAVKVLNQTMPLLTSETITYLRQPILAVFAPTSEEAEVVASRISVSYAACSPADFDAALRADIPEEALSAPKESHEEADGENTGRKHTEHEILIPAYTGQEILEILKHNITSYQGGGPSNHSGEDGPGNDKQGTDIAVDDTLADIASEELLDNEIKKQLTSEFISKTVSWGSPDRLFREADSVLDETYCINSEQSLSTAPTGTLAEYVGDRLTIYAATQWPFHVRNTVSEVCGISKKKVVVIQIGYHPTQDEKLIYPSLYGALCATATIKSGKPTRMICPEPSHRPEMAVRRRTAMNKNHEPIAELAEICVNVGAYPFYADEMIRQIIAGAVPAYDVHSAKITVRLITTPTIPRNHFRGLGFTSAIFTAETHASRIARAVQANPIGWRQKHLKSAKNRPAAQIKIKYALLKELLEDTAERADFYRKFAVYEMQRSHRRNISPFYRYARGIGVSSGYGISGFSRSFSEEKKHSVTMTLGENNMVTVALSIYEPEAETIWKTVISENLGMDTSLIKIECGDTVSVPDTGPNVLRREIHHITSLIERCCDSIKSQRFKEPLPIRVKRGFKQNAPIDSRNTKENKGSDSSARTKAAQQFSGLSWGAVIVELEIDTISLEPVIKGVWGSFECGRIFIPEKLVVALTRALHESIFQCGGVTGITETTPVIDVSIHDTDNGLPTSATETAQGLFAAAFLSAVSQALNRPVSTLPVRPEDILEILSKGGQG